MDARELEAGMPGGMPKELSDIPARTIFKIEELRPFLTSFVDATGKLDKLVVFATAEGTFLTTGKSDLPLTGVNPWFSNEMTKQLKLHGIKLKRK